MWIGFTGKLWDREEGRVRPRMTVQGIANNMETNLYVETRPPVIRTGKNEYGCSEIWVDG